MLEAFNTATSNSAEDEAAATLIGALVFWCCVCGCCCGCIFLAYKMMVGTPQNRCPCFSPMPHFGPFRSMPWVAFSSRPPPRNLAEVGCVCLTHVCLRCFSASGVMQIDPNQTHSTWNQGGQGFAQPVHDPGFGGPQLYGAQPAGPQPYGGQPTAVAMPMPPPSSNDLPPGWTSHQDPATGNTYYVSPDQQTTWDHPGGAKSY